MTESLFQTPLTQFTGDFYQVKFTMEEKEITSQQTLFTANLDIVRYIFQDETQSVNFNSIFVVNFPSILKRRNYQYIVVVL